MSKALFSTRLALTRNSLAPELKTRLKAEALILATFDTTKAILPAGVMAACTTSTTLKEEEKFVNGVYLKGLGNLGSNPDWFAVLNSNKN